MKRRKYVIIVLLIVAAFIRLSDLGPRTEFLGDQGVIASELLDTVKTGALPLTGLLHSNGIHSGPIMYYFLLPSFILAQYNPIGMAVFMALLGVATVYLVFLIGEKMYGRSASFVVALLYAVSPILSAQSRAIWTPAFLPFFTALMMYGLVKIRDDRKPAYLIPVAVSLAVLSQMYIPSLPTVLLLSCIGVGLYIQRYRDVPKRNFFGWLVISVLFFAVLCIPYIRYQWIHQFIDVRNIILTVIAPTPVAPELASSFFDKFGLIRLIFRNVLPVGTKSAIAVFGVIILLYGIMKGGFWGKVLACWLLVASLPILTYQGSLFEHYAASLVLIPFFLFGFTIRGLFKVNRFIALVIVFGSVFLQLSTAKNIPTYNDMSRTEHVVDEMIRQSNGRNFSFTLLSSRSFSDYHYRYFFKLKNIVPQVIYEDDYPLLFLICENGSCPTWDVFVKKENFPVLCYEKFCQPGYPLKRVAGWEYESKKDIDGAEILTLRLGRIASAFEKR